MKYKLNKEAMVKATNSTSEATKLQSYGSSYDSTTDATKLRLKLQFKATNLQLGLGDDTERYFTAMSRRFSLY